MRPNGKVIECEYCGKKVRKIPFNLARSKHHFCSSKCSGMFRSDKRHKITCEYCGKLVKISPYQMKRKHNFCSRECHVRWQRQEGKKRRVILKCTYCGKEFEVHNCRKDTAKFCSLICHAKWKFPIKWETRTCRLCGKKFRVKPSHPDVYCSMKCSRKDRIIPTSRTKPELKFIEICKKYNLPFRYTGDSSFWIGDVNPDFIENNGRKIAVDVFGDYWHSPLFRPDLPYNQTYEGRKKIIEREGWESIIIWGSELKAPSAEKIVLNRLGYSDTL